MDAQVICFDYYRTLVKLDRPFETIREYLANYLYLNSPGTNAEKFFWKFTRYRAVLATQPSFRLGIDILVESLEMACAFYHINSFADDFRMFCEELFMSPVRYEDAEQAIQELSSGYQIGLLTNADNYILHRSVIRNKFAFDFVITSEDARANKPDARIFNYAIKKLKKTADQIILIGDSLFEDISGALGAGMRCVWVNREHKEIKEGMQPPTWQVDRLLQVKTILD